MKLDNNWRIPEGFEAVKNYRNERSEGETVVGELRFPVEAGKSHQNDLTFSVGENHENVPALPLRERGAFRHEGWDIPTRWAIDANGVCWMDNAHGHPLGIVKPQILLGGCEREGERRRLQKVLGLPVDRPSWVKTALHYGWTPPEGWKDP